MQRGRPRRRQQTTAEATAQPRALVGGTPSAVRSRAGGATAATQRTAQASRSGWSAGLVPGCRGRGRGCGYALTTGTELHPLKKITLQKNVCLRAQRAAVACQV